MHLADRQVVAGVPICIELAEQFRIERFWS
jgi:hypothetical protein